MSTTVRSDARRRLLAGVAVILTLAGTGCPPEEVPEHVRRQRQLREQTRKRREEARKRFEQQQVRDRAEADKYKLWPARVREAYATLFAARGRAVSQAAQDLAHLGLDAAPALRTIATKEGIDEKKRATAALLLVGLYIFQPAELARLAQERSHPYIQKGAIEALGRLGDPNSEALLERLAREGREGLQGVLAGAQGFKHKWRYSDKQLLSLDRILQADTPEKLKIAMEALEDLTLERGLRAVIDSPSARPPVRAAVAYKFIELSKDRSEVLRGYCGKEQPELLRLVSVKHLLALGRSKDRRFLEQLARDRSDPMAPAMKQLLAGGSPR